MSGRLHGAATALPKRLRPVLRFKAKRRFRHSRGQGHSARAAWTHHMKDTLLRLATVNSQP